MPLAPAPQLRATRFRVESFCPLDRDTEARGRSQSQDQDESPSRGPRSLGSAGPAPPPWPGRRVLTRAGVGAVSCRCTCLRLPPRASVGPWGPHPSSWQCLGRSRSTPSVRGTDAGPACVRAGGGGAGWEGRECPPPPPPTPRMLAVRLPGSVSSCPARSRSRGPFLPGPLPPL